jgi:hypothetical protein
MLTLPHVVSVDRIHELDLSYCNVPIRLSLPALRHVTLTNSFSSLNSLDLFSTNVRSIHIILYYQSTNFVAPNWTTLHALSSLKSLTSLRMILYNMKKTLDDTASQMIVTVIPMLTDFGLYFRTAGFEYERDIHDRYDVKSVRNNQRRFIEELYQRILALSSGQQLRSVVESDGCGLTMWF